MATPAFVRQSEITTVAPVMTSTGKVPTPNAVLLMLLSLAGEDLSQSGINSEQDLDKIHSVSASLQLQRIGTVAAMTVLLVYISVINFIAICTLIYGITSKSAALTIRRIFLSKRPVELGLQVHHKNHSMDADGKHRSTACRRSAVISDAPPSFAEEGVKLHSSSFPYLLSLAISDFIIGSFIAPLQLDLYANGRWRFSSDFCDFWLALDIFFSTSSTLHTAAIAVDRWWTITRLQCNVVLNNIAYCYH